MINPPYPAPYIIANYVLADVLCDIRNSGAAMTTSAPSSGSETTATNASGSVTTSNPAVAPTPCVHHAAAGLMAAVGLAMAL